jgi:hypothetical protein
MQVDVDRNITRRKKIKMKKNDREELRVEIHLVASSRKTKNLSADERFEVEMDTSIGSGEM